MNYTVVYFVKILFTKEKIKLNTKKAYKGHTNQPILQMQIVLDWFRGN